jgi:choice-of-anchor B domain-containing protein
LIFKTSKRFFYLKNIIKIHFNMKQFLFAIALFATFSATGQFNQQAFNTEFLGNWDDPTLPVHPSIGLVYNSVWGWEANGKEYAVIGTMNKVLFFDVTNPANIIPLAEFAGNGNTIWREFKKYKNRVYEVCDGCAEGLMIFDVSNPQNITRTYFSNALFNKSHTITCDTTSGRLYMNGTDVISSGIMVLDISANPDAPTVIATPDLTLGSGQGGYVHDSYVRHDTVYASHGYGGLAVWDFKNAAAPTVLATVNTGGYNHSSWLTNDGKTMLYAEEIPAGAPLHLIGFENLANNEIIMKKAFKTPLHAPKDSLMVYHNVYIKEDLAYVASYLDGLQVFDIKNPTDPKQVAWFDTQTADSTYKYATPNGGQTVYAGAWGAYPWLPSGNLLISDMQNGLFVVKLKPTPSATNEIRLSAGIYPNPFIDEISIDFGDKILVNGVWTLYNYAGGVLQTGQFNGVNRTCLKFPNLVAGIYVLKIVASDGRTYLRKMVKN